MTVRIVGQAPKPIAFRITCVNCRAIVEFDKEDEVWCNAGVAGVYCPGCGDALLSCDAEPIFVRERTGRPLVVP